MHWYVYHSQKSMGHTYAELGAPVVFSTKNQPKLCHGDTVWVVEGDLSTPIDYAIVDCFAVQGTDMPPFPGSYSEFKLKVIGERSLLPKPIALDKSAPWFSELRDRFITKQRFFCSLEDHRQIQEDFAAASGVAI
jgi:hypothetical protein